ncbi:MAG: hypothetical protein JSS49_25375 [Planctomycetes bacterium]|nr:hypothetical protein [Planctomycetota bacterium]
MTNNCGIQTLVLTTFLATLPFAVSRTISAQDKPAEAIQVDKQSKTVTIACKVAPRKLPNLSEIYPIEVVASLAAPKGQKAHETVVTFDAKPSDIHKALEGLGLKAGKPAKGEGAAAAGPEVKIFLELPGAGGLTRRIPIEKALMDRKTQKAMPPLKWVFTGSITKQPDPNKAETVYGADTTGTLIAIFPVTDETVFQTNLTMKDEPLIKLETNNKVLPEIGTDVQLVIQIP